jgi:hypothetical protein
MEPLVSVSRDKEFKEAIIVDSRFGKRKMFLNTKDKPSIAVYGTPGKGSNGEHQN